MPTLIPLVPSEGLYDFSTSVNGYSLTFVVRWNAVEKAFFVDIYEQSGAPIVTGIKIVLGAYLGRWSQHPLFREGVLIAIDSSGDLVDAGFDDLGDRVELWYYTANELISNALNVGR